MDDFEKNMLENELLCTIDRIRNYERKKTIDECIKIIKFYEYSWDGIQLAIRELEAIRDNDI